MAIPSSTTTLALAAALVAAAPLAAQHQHQAAQGHGSPPDSALHRALNERGRDVMGFDQSRTTHHFLLHPDGGTIVVTANDADEATVHRIRMHLSKVATDFARGDFSMPQAIHKPEAAAAARPGDASHLMHTTVTHSVDHGAMHAGGGHTSVGPAAALFVPGAATMARLKSSLRYEYASSPLGASVSITAADAEALAAVHDFLRYQINEHRTGDNGAVRAR